MEYFVCFEVTICTIRKEGKKYVMKGILDNKKDLSHVWVKPTSTMFTTAPYDQTFAEIGLILRLIGGILEFTDVTQ